MPERIATKPNEMEVWQSSVKGKIYVKRFDRRGDLTDECVQPGHKLHISPEERLYNQENAADKSLDPFLNGFLVPVKLLETAEDYDLLKENPNHLTEDEMRVLLKNPKALDKLQAAVDQIENITTLRRLLVMTEDESLDVTLKQASIVRARLEAVEQAPTYDEVQTVMTSDGRPVVATVAPKSPAPPNSNVGRRVTDIRG